MKVFITGIPGFAGSFLTEELLAQGYEVYGTHLPNENLQNLAHIKDKIQINPLDFNKPEIIPQMLACVKPDYIFHLAAQSSVKKSFDSPQESYQANFFGTYHMLEAARELKKLRGFLFVSSSDIYGIVKPKDLPLTENHPLRPVSPYGVSKAAADMLCYQYYINFEMPIVRVRAFNHSGPRQGRGFVVTDFSAQIAELEMNRRKRVLKVGDLSSRRDISDVRDIVRGYRLAVEKGQPGETYQLCSGHAVRIETLLKKLLRHSTVSIDYVVDKHLIRKSEVPILKGDASKAEKKLGYKRNYSIDDTLKDCLEYYRSLQGGKSGRSSKKDKR